MSKAVAETRSVVVEREIPHPPEKVWRALTQPHLISEWLMKNDFRPAVGHRFSLRGEWGGVLDCEVLAIEPHTTLSYTWNFAHDDAAFNLNSVVTFTLTPTSTGTRTLPNCASSYAGRSRTPNPRWPDGRDDSGPAGIRWGRCVHGVGAGGRA